MIIIHCGQQDINILFRTISCNGFNEIVKTSDVVFTGNDLPDEYTGSKYTYSLKGALAKAKANAAQGIPEMLEIAVGKSFQENKERKHQWDAKKGWYRYDSRFALPVFADNGEVERYNVFRAVTTLVPCTIKERKVPKTYQRWIQL